jgi:hypothetical protein
MTDRNQGASPNDKGSGDTSGDPQIDRDTGRPVAIAPDGERENDPEEIDGRERLKIDPNSRIPRPVQPDLA